MRTRRVYGGWSELSKKNQLIMSSKPWCTTSNKSQSIAAYPRNKSALRQKRSALYTEFTLPGPTVVRQPQACRRSRAS